jgi:hypothetical protein
MLYYRLEEKIFSMNKLDAQVVFLTLRSELSQAISAVQTSPKVDTTPFVLFPFPSLQNIFTPKLVVQADFQPFDAIKKG